MNDQTESTPGSTRRIRWFRRRDLVVLGAFIGLLLLAYALTMRMPGQSYRGPLPPLTESQRQLRDQLREDVAHLAVDIGPRHVGRIDSLRAARDWIERKLVDAGHHVQRQTYEVDGEPVDNLIAEKTGTQQAEQIIVLGAHYDAVPNSPGANDNATGIAALLAVAGLLADQPLARTIRFCAFVNEEPPHFQTSSMGSMVYAQACRDRGDRILGMIALDGLGCFSDEPESQQYPAPISAFYPSEGNFIAFVSSTGSRSWLNKVIGSFRRHAQFPSEGAALPGFLPGAGWSDHWAFWQAGYKGLLITDTLPFRYRYYHSPMDTPDRIDFDRMVRVVEPLAKVIADLAR